MRAPKVLMVTGAYWPELSGGGLQCRTMIQALGDRIPFRVFTTCTDRALEGESRVDGVSVTRVFVDVTRPLTKLSALLKTAAFFVREGTSFNVVHLHGFSSKSIALVLLAKLWGKLVVLTIHTAEHDEYPRAKAMGPLAAWAYRQADLYLAISRKMADNAVAAGLPASRVRVVPNGLDTDRFRPPAAGEREAARIDLGARAPGLRWILFVGFFSRDKCPDVLFDAWRKLRGLGGPPTGLLFVGATEAAYQEVDPAIAGGIRDAAKAAGVADQIVFAGPRPDIERAYHAADIFVMPSAREAFGMVLAEAMASGLPVIASALPGVTDDIVDDGRSGVLVAPRNVDALAEALRRVLDDAEAAAAMGRDARESVIGRFGLDAARRRWLEAYEALR